MSTKKDLVRRISKAVRRELRDMGIARPRELVLCESPSQAFVVAQYLLPSLLPKTKMTVKKSKGKDEEREKEQDKEKSKEKDEERDEEKGKEKDEEEKEKEEGNERKKERDKEKEGLIPISREELNAQFLNTFLKKKKNDDESLFKNRFLFRTVSHSKLREYARMHGLEERNLDENIAKAGVKDAAAMIARVQERHEQTGAALQKSYEHVRSLMEKKQH